MLTALGGIVSAAPRPTIANLPRQVSVSPIPRKRVRFCNQVRVRVTSRSYFDHPAQQQQQPQQASNEHQQQPPPTTTDPQAPAQKQQQAEEEAEAEAEERPSKRPRLVRIQPTPAYLASISAMMESHTHRHDNQDQRRQVLRQQVLNHLMVVAQQQEQEHQHQSSTLSSASTCNHPTHNQNNSDNDNHQSCHRGLERYLVPELTERRRMAVRAVLELQDKLRQRQPSTIQTQQQLDADQAQEWLRKLSSVASQPLRQLAVRLAQADALEARVVYGESADMF